MDNCDVQSDIETINKLVKKVSEYKESHPDARLGYYLTYPSLLNAYREGDIGFDECVSALAKVNGLNERLNILCDCWKAEDEKLNADYQKLEAAEAVIGEGRLEKYKGLILRERGRLQRCVLEVQDIMIRCQG